MVFCINQIKNMTFHSIYIKTNCWLPANYANWKSDIKHKCCWMFNGAVLCLFKFLDSSRWQEWTVELWLLMLMLWDHLFEWWLQNKFRTLMGMSFCHCYSISMVRFWANAIKGIFPEEDVYDIVVNLTTRWQCSHFRLGFDELTWI